jgi:hypothetical protein
MTRSHRNRRGYALILVAAFCVLFVTFMGVAWRQMASALCTFSNRSEAIQEDQGAIMALAQAMRALEVGPPPLTEYATKPCYGTVSVPVMQNMRVKYPDNVANYPETPSTYYYQINFELTGNSTTSKSYKVTVTKLSDAPTNGTLLKIDDFGKNGPL